MNTQSTPSKLPRSLKSRALLGTALALVLGGAFVAEGVILPHGQALADPVRVQGAAPVSFAPVVDAVRPAVVSVRVKAPREDASLDSGDMPDFPQNSPMERFFRQFRGQNGPQQHQPRMAMSLGSGFFISDDGYVVTNNHVIDKGQAMTVITDDGTEYTAKVIGKDDKTDLALLKIDAPGKKFTYVKFSEGDVHVGDWVVAVGNPFGLGGTVTAGIVSARGREIGAGPYDDFIQIDAAVNRGNSGGPTFNLNGEVIGVNTAIFSPSGGNVGIAFDIPASTAERIIQDLKEHGSVTRGWLGVQIQSITPEIASSLKLDGDKGALVAEPQENSPALAAGLQAGDAIVAVNGQASEGSARSRHEDLSLRPGHQRQVSPIGVTVRAMTSTSSSASCRLATSRLRRKTTAARKRRSLPRSTISAWRSARRTTRPASSSPMSTPTARRPSAACSPVTSSCRSAKARLRPRPRSRRKSPTPRPAARRQSCLG